MKVVLFFKWQWELVRISQWIENQKIFLPMLLLLLLISCRSYKSVSCEYDYFPTKEEMVLDSSLLNNLDQEVKINDHTKINVYKYKNEYFKSVQIDTLNLSNTLNKFIIYSSHKKITYS